MTPYRSVSDAIITDTRLGPPISLLTVTSAGVNRLDENALCAVRDSINGWKEQEHAIFRALEPGAEITPVNDDAPGLRPDAAG